MSAPRVVPSDFPEPFAVEWGHDEYGTFMSFAVEDVVQRMRWIPPGSFMMGLPENQIERFGDEMQHCVKLTQGYWLGDTPVTQELWRGIMGTNPSEFKEATKPVETVSWDDCQAFLQRLNARLDGLEARLPAEAEWEYACRAGTTTATWVGDFQRDSIAWYRGNSGGTTHPVAQKAANPWGLYDMLGNVWEWCADFVSYDPIMVQTSRDVAPDLPCVMRGGSWRSRGMNVRAAYRTAGMPRDRSTRVGLRLARTPATRISEKK
jgi:formylglycine-generating enzyme